MTFRISLIVGFLVLVSTAGAAPKPWQWTPRDAASHLVSENPQAIPATVPGYEVRLAVATCAGRGRAVQRRFTAFRCAATFRTPSAQKAVLWVKVRQAGKGLACVSVKSLAAVPAGCLTRTETRVLGEPQDAENIVREWLQVNHDLVTFTELGCLGHGAGFYVCEWASTRSGSASVTLTTKAPRIRLIAWTT